MKLTKLAIMMVAVAAMASCSDEPEEIVPAEYTEIAEAQGQGGGYAGMYLLNEGNMGSNKCTLDYLNFNNGVYGRNLYAQQNPDVALELGDTGNDIAIYNGRLYIVVNGSHKVEVLDAATAKRIGKVDIDNPRYIAFDGKNAYVSSYVGGADDHGTVVRFDTDKLQVTGSVTVGLQPEEIVITDGKLYVANSCISMTPNYDNTISVVDLGSFKLEGSIAVDINMHHLKIDSEKNLWVSSRGNYYDIPSRLYKLSADEKGNYSVAATVPTACSNMAIYKDKLYYYASEWSNETYAFTISYGVVDTKTAKIEPESFITDGTEGNIVAPYAIEVNPGNGDVVITDAKNYTSSGAVYCYRQGRRIWNATTGDIPGNVVFRR